MLTKADILQGTKKTHIVQVEEFNGEVAIKPLSQGQWAQVEIIKSGGIKFRGKPGKDSKDYSGMEMEMDISEVQKNDHEGDCVAVAYALSINETWTVQDVKDIQPPGVVKRLAEEVYRISGVTVDGLNEIRNFRKNTGGEKLSEA